MQDVAGAMLSDFAKSLSEMMAAEQEGVAEPEAPPADVAAEREALDLTGAVGGVLRQRLARWTGFAALRRLLSRVR